MDMHMYTYMHTYLLIAMYFDSMFETVALVSYMLEVYRSKRFWQLVQPMHLYT